MNLNFLPINDVGVLYRDIRSIGRYIFLVRIKYFAPAAVAF